MQQPDFNDAYYRKSRQVLDSALDSAPAYDAWKQFDPGRNLPIDVRYTALPLLTKQTMRDHFPQGLVPGGRDVAAAISSGEIEYVQTNGTTSEKVTSLWNQSWWNASEAASWKLNVHTSQLDYSCCREALLASALSVGFLSNDDLPCHSRILNDRYLFLNEKATTVDLNDAHYRRMASELRTFKPVVLEANPSMLAHLCWWSIDNGIALYTPQVIILTYEYPSKVHLKSIRQVFNAPVISSYGTTETGYVFMQCEHGRFHQNTEFCRVDFLPLKTVHGGPDLGCIAVTTFDNPWSSIVRFDVGDIVRIDSSSICRCGQTGGYTLSAIEGRFTAATCALSGRLVTTRQVDDALSAISGLRDYELRQRDVDHLYLKVTSPEPTPQLLSACREALRPLYGQDAVIGTEFADRILPAASGKFRRTFADFTFNEKDFLA